MRNCVDGVWSDRLVATTNHLVFDKRQNRNIRLRHHPATATENSPAGVWKRLQTMQQPESVRPLIITERPHPTGDTHELRPRETEEGNPFTFTPRLIHLHKDHELFEDGDITRHMYLQDLYISEADDKPTLSVSEFACHISGCSAVFSTLEEYEHHYNSLHRHVCCSCRRSLPSARLLDIHIQEWHDSLFAILAQRQDMYQCLVEGCGQKFRTSKLRKDHLIRLHKYPPDFRFDKTKKDRGTREMKRQQQKDTAMEVVDDVCESEGVCEVLFQPTRALGNPWRRMCPKKKLAWQSLTLLRSMQIFLLLLMVPELQAQRLRNHDTPTGSPQACASVTALSEASEGGEDGENET
ncbi:Zinc finger protein 511 [Collichthys lucidus]|uniref:Zinc finger protein 511 n=1 Tax=Collichthys lucidus TaxID=240159 RepID=A0A4U5VBS6_COLLU|nr:Zinc finger protein 511 [Collichthys lucidus]